MNKSLTRRTVAAALATATLSVLPVPAALATPSPVITGNAPSLHPEGIAYDPYRRAFLVGSVRHGTVSVVRRNGSVSTLVRDPALVSAIGIHVDARRGRLLVANADPGAGTRSSPRTQQRLAGVGIYDLSTGHRIRYVDLAAVASDGGRHLANDIAVAPDGTAYVTDSFAPIVYRVPVGGAASVFVRDVRLSSDSYGANGIVWRSGRLIIGKYDDGTLWSVSTRNAATLRQVPLDRRLPAPDGLTLRPNGALTVVNNTLSPSGANVVLTVRLFANGRRGSVVREQRSPEPVPTTAAIGPLGHPYVLSGRLDLLFAGTPSDTFTVRRF
ncbi:hypothetical protein SMC26_32850 [Actinomadura fulvescens]|uniref:SMP-30/gluconolactonase/LRE family protein n=1 Tax=Actinomadura fulvescens TaxID=46160 RepID=A0ABN3QBR4_9ACTN